MLSQSYGLMVNYLYDDEASARAVIFAENKELVLGNTVEQWALLLPQPAT